MNKLISRNPIQRFKEGKKIQKFQWAGTLPSEKLSKEEFKRKYPHVIDDLTFYDFNPWNGGSYSSFVGDLRGIGFSTGKNEYGFPTTKTETAKVRTAQSNGSQSQGNQNKGAKTRNRTNIRGTLTPIAKPTPTSFMGQGIQQGWRGTVGKAPELTDQQKLQLINTGKFTDNDFTTAGALQTALNNYFGGTVGSISVDNKWGSQSQKALNAALAATKDPGTYMNLSQSLDLPNLDGTKTRTNIHGRYNITGLLSNKMTNPENISTINLSNASPAITPQVSNVNLNRAQTRDLMRAHNLNPYDYSGAQRKALRNFYSTGNYDSNLLSGIISKDYKWLKKGGIISRNPVKQFKIKFQKNYK